MIPILYNNYEYYFADNGIGRLAEATSCTVEEERNGPFELTMEYPMSGAHFADLQLGRYIYCRHSDKLDKQAFEIYNIEKTMEGMVTVHARHISYKLNKVVIEPYTTNGIVSALSGLENHSMNTNQFTFWTDKTTSGTFTVNEPTSCRSLLGGTAGSILDVFGGGEYEFDMWTVKLHAARGSDSGVTVRYGKNLTSLVSKEDNASVVSGIAPFWRGSDDTMVTLPEGVIYASSAPGVTAPYTDESKAKYVDESDNVYEAIYVPDGVTPVDFSQDFQDAPTVAQLRAKANSWLANNAAIFPDTNITISFVALWQTPEYANVAPLQRVGLCDTISVFYPKLGVSAKAKVVKVKYDVLLERYESMEVGNVRTSLYEMVTQAAAAAVDVRGVSYNDLTNAINHATELIKGGLGGYVVMNGDANGYPEEILIMDTPDISTAVNVIRMNKNGIGFSTTGYYGNYTTAWTIDGAFNADFITAGTMSANRIKGGTLQLGGTSNGNGVLEVYNGSGTQIGYWDNTGIHITSGDLNIGNGNFTVSNTGAYRSQNTTALGTEWLSINESVIKGGLNSSEDGILDLSAQYTDQTRHVALTSLTSDVNIDSARDIVSIAEKKITNRAKDGNIINTASGDIEANATGANYVKTQNGNIYVQAGLAQGNTSANLYLRAANKIYVNSPDTGMTARSLIDMIYPVNSIYMSVVNQNPAQLFGVGTWVRIAKGEFLIGVSEGEYDAESEGGSFYHKHQFGQDQQDPTSTNLTGAATGSTGGPSTTYTGATTLGTNHIPSHTHGLYTSASLSGYGLIEDANAQFKGQVIVTTTSANKSSTDSAGGGSAHSHTLNSHTHSLNSHTHTLPGTDLADSTPPYFAVYMWKRTA